MYIQDFDTVISQLRPHLANYLQNQGIDTNSNFLCPFPDHKDSIPSCTFIAESHRFYCHACGRYGDIFDAVKIFENKTKIGIEWIQEVLMPLAERFGIDVKTGELTEEEAYKLDIYRAYKLAADLINLNTLSSNKLLQEEIERRKWDASKLTEQNVGTVDDFASFRKSLRSYGFTTAFLDEIELGRKDIFSPNNIVFTWKDEKGRVVGFTSRTLNWEKEKQAAEENGESFKKPKYNNIRTTGLKFNIFQKSKRFFGIETAVKATGPLYVFEGQADVVTARCHGFDNCIAIAGGILRDDHIHLLKQLGFYDIVLCFDSDPAGIEKLTKAIEKLSGNKDLRVRIIHLPPTEDPDSFIRKNGIDAFRQLAVWSAFEWRLNQYKEEDDENDICRQMIPFIVNEPSPVTREKLCKTLAQRTGVSLQAITNELNLLIDAKAHEREKERQVLLDEAIYQLRNNPSHAELILQKTQTNLLEILKRHNIDTLSSEDFVYALDQQKEAEEKLSITNTGFKLGSDLKSLEESFRGNWDEGVFICVGGKPNVGKSAFLSKLAYCIAENNNDAVVIYHTIDDTAEQLVPRFVAIAESSHKLSINMVRQPNYWTKTAGLSYVTEKRETGYSKVRQLAQDGRLVVKDLKHGSNIAFIENLICYFQERYPHRKIVYILDNLHKLRDFDTKDERVRFKAISETMKGITIRRRCCIITSVEYTKLASGIKPTNFNISECLTGDTQIYNWDKGICERIDQINPGVTRTPTLNTDTFKVEPQKITALLDRGIQEIYEVETKTGRKLKTTLNHPFFTGSKWEKLSALKVKDSIAIPRSLNLPEHCSIAIDLARLLGYLAGDGSYGRRDPQARFTPSFINSTKDYYEDVMNIVKRNFPVIQFHIRENKGSKDINFSYKKNHKNPLLNWLKEIGVAGQTEENKTIATCVLAGNKEIKANYLAGLFATDGCIYNSKKDCGRRIKFNTTSKILAKQTQQILMHLGIQSTFCSYTKKGKEKLNPYAVVIKNGSISKFLEQIPIIGYKEERLKDIVAKVQNSQFNQDKLSPAFSEQVLNYRKENFLRRRVKKDVGYFVEHNSCINLTVAKRMLEEDFIPKTFSKWIESDIYWDQIISITPLGKEQVWDLTIENTHNFVANDIFCHNTVQVIYDASAIIHIHNDLADNPESFSIFHEDVIWNGEKTVLPRIECIIGKNKISEQKTSFFLDFWPASSDFRSIDQETVVKEAKQKQASFKQNNEDELSEVY